MLNKKCFCGKQNKDYENRWKQEAEDTLVDMENSILEKARRM